MDNVIQNIINSKYNIDITGKIFICDQLCDVIYEYQDYDKLIIFNKNKYLEIQYQNDQGKITYNGDTDTDTQYKDYYLKKLVLISPPKHYINSVRNIANMELILIHESYDQKRYQLISIPLEPTFDKTLNTELSYKLIEKFCNNIPNKTQGSKIIDNIDSWNPQDLLPTDKSFYTYNSPFDDTINWIIYENSIYVPIELKKNYDKYILNTNKTYSQELLNTKVPINPNNLILFNHKYIKNISKKCSQKINKELNNDSKNHEETKKNEVNNEITQSLSNLKLNTDQNKSLNNSGNINKNMNNSGNINNSNIVEISWGKWILFAFGILIILGIISYIIYKLINSDEVYKNNITTIKSNTNTLSNKIIENNNIISNLNNKSSNVIKIITDNVSNLLKTINSPFDK